MSKKLTAGSDRMMTLVSLLLFIALFFSCSKDLKQYEPYLPTNPNAHPGDSDVKVSYYIGTPGKPGAAIPSEFLGFSFETEALVHADYFNVDHGSFIQLIQSLGEGTGVLRIGGGSADHAYWNVGKHGSTADSTWLTPADIDRYLVWAGMTGWRSMFTLNLGTASVTQNVAMAKYIQNNPYKFQTPSFEIGNEPDLYPYNGLRPTGYTVEQYSNEFEERYQAIRSEVPDAGFTGPSTSGRSWLRPFTDKESSLINAITTHFYQLGIDGDSAVTIDKLLNGKAAVETLADTLNSTAGLYNLPYRINESSSVNGAVDGVSNTFASALWTVDYLYTLAYKGAAGVNFHGGGDDPHTPISYVNGSFVAKPMYYGMLMFSKGSGGTMMTVEKGPADSVGINLSAYGVKGRDGKTRITIVNKDAKNAAVGLAIAGGPFSYAFVLRLTAPSPGATSGVRFGGSGMTATGTWVPPATYETAALDGGYCAVKVPAYSAVLLILQ